MEPNKHQGGSLDGKEVFPHREARENIEDCEAKAERLFELLVAESKALRRFDSGLLLQLVSRKEYCLGVLWESMRSLKEHPTQGGPPEDSGRLTKLKGLLSEINRLNRANAVFIEGALEHCQDLLMTLMPTVYGQTEGSPSHRFLDCRGVTLKKKA
jgi:flagellar biosynthesis/type III secretory pathway chaperone